MIDIENAPKVENDEILRITYNNKKAGKRRRGNKTRRHGKQSCKRTRKCRKNKNKRRNTRRYK